MGSVLEASSRYGGLSLTCDEASFARIRDHILAEPSVAEAIGNPLDGLNARFISVRMPPAKDASGGPRWLGLVWMILASIISGVPLIVGYVTIFHWLMRAMA